MLVKFKASKISNALKEAFKEIVLFPNSRSIILISSQASACKIESLISEAIFKDSFAAKRALFKSGV